MSRRQNHPIKENCNNCGTLLTGKFCHQCGQKGSVHKLTLHDVFHEFWHAFAHADKGIFKLIIDLTIHPRSVYDNYFNGQRKKYFSPVLFFLVTAGILAYLYPYVFDYEDKITNLHNEYGRDMYHLTKYRALILLPVQAILLWVVFARRYNLAEITVFLLFCLGFTYTFRIVFLPAYFPLITYKHSLDNIFIIASYLILWLHGSMVLARGKVLYVLLILVIVNIFFLLDNVLQLYMLFGKNMYATNNIGIHSFWDILKMSYYW